MARSFFEDDKNLVKTAQAGEQYDEQGNAIPVAVPESVQAAKQTEQYDPAGNPIPDSNAQVVYTAPAPPAAAPTVPQEQVKPPVTEVKPVQEGPVQAVSQSTGTSEGQSKSWRESVRDSEMIILNKKTGQHYHEGDVIPQDANTTVVNPDGSPADPVTAQKIMTEIYSKGPTYDPKRPEEIRRIARMSAIGKGMSVLTEALSLGLGGRVRRRPDDQTIQRLYKDQKAYDDNYTKRRDEYAIKEGMNRVRAATGARNESPYGLYFKNTGSSYGESTADNSSKRETLALRKRQIDLDEAKFKAAQKKAAGRGGGKSDLSYWQVWDANGNPVAEVGITDGEIQGAYNVLLDDPNIGSDIMNLQGMFGAKFDLNIMKLLISQNWLKVPGVQKFLHVRQKADGEWEQYGESKPLPTYLNGTSSLPPEAPATQTNTATPAQKPAATTTEKPVSTDGLY
jgi:hypothetical protein